MTVFIKRHGIHEISANNLCLELEEGSTVQDLVKAYIHYDGIDLAGVSGIPSLFLRDGDMIALDTTLHDQDRITVITPLGNG